MWVLQPSSKFHMKNGRYKYTKPVNFLCLCYEYSTVNLPLINTIFSLETFGLATNQERPLVVRLQYLWIIWVFNQKGSKFTFLFLFLCLKWPFLSTSEDKPGHILEKCKEFLVSLQIASFAYFLLLTFSIFAKFTKILT